MKKRIETDIPTYEKLKQSLSEIYPDIKVELVDSDPALFNLGFVLTVPCTVDVYATKEQIEEIMDIAMHYEINAYNTADYPKYDDPDYILYERYGWLWDFFYSF
ncbi:MAG: hypothetical protein ACI4SS_04145 [Clostridia bacterium]